ncbi:M1 family metallopeptidase [Yinghuangia seranimata]|uniref:M1 family metallopeptidase n=1 Tax=Yinghuangia seranimata TaxID=408067 RepID=UPI00248AF9C1|nr:M1 family metallopeptidase [Yinghuangia seranimata]MDI2126157.1 M1 family metallopeptidase [Yinghuangia seranimata]
MPLPAHRAARPSALRVVAAAAVLALVSGCTSSSAPERPLTRPSAAGAGAGAGASGASEAAGGDASDPLFPALGNPGYDVQDYTLALDWTPQGNRLTGTATLAIQATAELDAFTLDFHAMDVQDVTVDGAPARTRRDDDKLTVTPAAPIPAGRAFTARIAYSGVPKTITDPDGSHEGWMKTDDGAVALGEPAGAPGWFPGNHAPYDKAGYDITVTVPQGLTAVSNGKLVDHAVHDGRESFHWNSPEPMASYLAMVAIGRFRVSEDTAAGVPAYYAVDPEEESDRTNAIPATVDAMLAWADRRFGPYPFASTGAVVGHLPDLGYALETQTRPFFETAPEPDTVVHEMSHQWFGDSVTPRTWNDMWLNEGFATYTEWLWAEDHGGPSTRTSFETSYDRSGPAGQGVWAFPPGAPGSPKNVSGPPVYERGAMALQKLREAVGDEAFFTIVRTWLSDHKHGVVETADLRALAEHVSGKPLGPLFDTWVYGKAKPPKD